jgi:hypothetical protein
LEARYLPHFHGGRKRHAGTPQAGNNHLAACLGLLFLPVTGANFPKKARFTAFFAVAHPLLNLPGRKSHYEDR